METAGQRLEGLRKAMGLSAREVDRLAGLTSGHTRVLEQQAECRAQVNTLESIARALSVEPAWLVFGTGDGPDFEALRAKHGSEPTEADS